MAEGVRAERCELEVPGSRLGSAGVFFEPRTPDNKSVIRLRRFSVPCSYATEAVS